MSSRATFRRKPKRGNRCRNLFMIVMSICLMLQIGTHAGRRTFICNALALGIPPQVVMKWTGHSDYKAMKPYIDIADDIKANAMSKFNQL